MQFLGHGHLAYQSTKKDGGSATVSRLCITLSIDHFSDDDMLRVCDMVLGKAMAIDVGTYDRCICIINVHSSGAGSAAWSSKLAF